MNTKMHVKTGDTVLVLSGKDYEGKDYEGERREEGRGESGH